MSKTFCVMVAFSWVILAIWAMAATAPEVTACGMVSAADAQKLLGGELDVQEFAKIPTAGGAGTYDSVCTYIAKGGNFANPVGSSRFLDVTLHFLNSADEMKTVYEDSLGQYRDMAKAADAPFKNALITPLTGFGDRAFVVEAVTDPKTNYKSALIVFYKGRTGGTVSAWKKPQSSLETTKTVLRHILSKLP
ncbi:MAG: hypothetical protein ACTHLX_20090 [Candidatus Binatia bacterium]